MRVRQLPEDGTAQSGEDDFIEIIGETRNISETGLALSLPTNLVGRRYLATDSGPIHVTLELPAGSVRMIAIPKWSNWYLENGEKSYLLGLRIAEMSDEEWVLMVRYVQAFL